ncbi:CLUMA_CG006667, isoform A [Clunio marinus]|uniref:CLUMA_CG006667, isoform A n=1 Tax=Clunio marinus TaxID=568069 RepID=A0A1J1HYB4_9DIPT|nr:CLUMA_CG006667, isoform A [Clunio marinus]
MLSYYLLNMNRVGDDDKHDVGIRELVVLHSDKMAHDESHDCRIQRVVNGGKTDDDETHMTLHNFNFK